MFPVPLYARIVRYSVFPRLTEKACRAAKPAQHASAWVNENWFPRSCEQRGVFDGHIVFQRISLSREALDNMQILIVERTVSIQPSFRFDVDHIHDQGVSIPESDGSPVPDSRSLDGPREHRRFLFS